MRPIDFLRTKDSIIRFRAPGEVKQKLKMDAGRLGITPSRLALGIVAMFLVLEPKQQKDLLEGKAKMSGKRVSGKDKR